MCLPWGRHPCLPVLAASCRQFSTPPTDARRTGSQGWLPYKRADNAKQIPQLVSLCTGVSRPGPPACTWRVTTQEETEEQRGKKVSEETRAQQGALEKDCSISLTPRFSGVASRSPSVFNRFNGFLCVCRAVRNVLRRAPRTQEDGTSRAEDALSATSSPFGRD